MRHTASAPFTSITPASFFLSLLSGATSLLFLSWTSHKKSVKCSSKLKSEEAGCTQNCCTCLVLLLVPPAQASALKKMPGFYHIWNISPSNQVCFLEEWHSLATTPFTSSFCWYLTHDTPKPVFRIPFHPPRDIMRYLFATCSTQGITLCLFSRERDRPCKRKKLCSDQLSGCT